MQTAIADKKILVCDDDPDILDVISHLLVHAGYVVNTATEHEEFFEKFKAVQPDLILLDVRMPERDGFWIAQELQRLNNKAPIMFITAHNRSVYRLCAPIAGAVDFVVKPFDPDVLLERVKKAVNTDADSSNWFLYATCHHPYVEQTTE